ncbi:amidase [Methylobacterium brachythecii]|uniref:Amidase n=1 Tax=Methylobacterium brachythecii TaxID=1176177 RepID=A0A7W6F680_9HYPH|nr:amidase [Methylobacterium brachythecii]MBB3901716.1 Asp-tRNA(Asn)/Glu-tRNA(Gln) amidotransferase A subunit family amidase [Methylobacterium brachythecii]GLS43927.1 amidase [Methylobacterium brachythecii]
MLSLIDIRTRIEAGDLTHRQAIAEAREAIAERDPSIGAVVCSDPEPAVPEEGRLAGIAVGIKDIIDTAHLPTQMGSPIYQGWQPRADAAIVSRLRQLGAVPLAKTATTAFAGLDPTVTVNPRDHGHTPGGSSSGTAAAVAAGMLPLALGTQTGGSVIRPAAFCGVAAIKASFRLLPTVGVKTFSWALDTLGLFGASVPDIARALALIADRPEIDLTDDAPSAPRIGICLQGFAGDADPDAAAALSQAARAAEAAGAIVTDVSLPDAFARAWDLHPVIQDFEARQALAWEYAHHREALPALLGPQLDRAQALTAAQYDSARREAHHARRQLKDLFGEVDAILTYSAVGRAPRGLGSTGDARFNRLWTLMGVPCVNVPVPGDGLPLGVQVIARFGRDGQALAVARAIELALARG